MAKIISIVNQKGGVGKTTTAINLAAGLAHQGKKTLLIDIDSQGNATSGLGVQKAILDQTIYDVFSNEADLAAIIRNGPMENLRVAPANSDLLSAEWFLGSEDDGKTRLKNAINTYTESGVSWLPDYIVVDCPPSLGQLTINAIITSNSILVPVQCEYYALEGLTEILQSATMLRDRLNPQLRLEGILLTMADRRLNLSQQVEQEIRNVYAGLVFQNVIFRSVRLSEAPSHGVPITMYDPSSKGAEAYLGVAEEVIRHETQSPGPWPVRPTL